MRLQPDETPFAPNCSEGAPVRQGSDPLALSLGRLVQECPERKVTNLLEAATLLAEHGRGKRVHVRAEVGVFCAITPCRGIPTDAQRDYWSRRPQP